MLIISIILAILLSLPSVQTAIANKITNKINEENNVNISIDKVQITLDGKIIIKDFMVSDHHEDTLFRGNRLETRLHNILNFSKTNKLSFDITHIDNLQAKIINYKGEKLSNLDIFVENLEGKSEGADKAPPFELVIPRIFLKNAKFQYLEMDNVRPKVIDFDHLHAEVSDFSLKGSDLFLNVEKMQFTDRHSGIEVKQLATNFYYGKRQMKVEKLLLKTEHSMLDADIVFNNQKNFADFLNKVRISGKLNKTYIATDDLNKFSNVFSPKHYFKLSGKVKGTLNDLILNNFKTRTDNNIVIDGDIRLYKIFDSKKYVIRSDAQNINFSFAKLKQILPRTIEESIPKNLMNLGNVSGQGLLEYNPNYLNSDLNLSSDLGDFVIKLKMNQLNSLNRTSYKGHVETSHFKLDKLFQSQVSDITANFDIDGKGLSLASLNSNLDGKIAQLRFKNYDYKNIDLRGKFKKKLFEGLFNISDPNLEMEFSGLVDFSHKVNKFDFKSRVCHADLQKLHLSTRDTISLLEGEIYVKAEGNTFDNIFGNAQIKNVYYKNQFDQYKFKDFKMTSAFKDSVRTINFISPDILDGYIKGKFKFDHIPLLVKNAVGSVFANYEIKPIENEQDIKFNFNIHNKIVGLFYPNLKISKNTIIKGKMESEDNKLKLKLTSPTISYAGNKLVNVNVRIDNKNPLYNTFIKIDTIQTPFYTFRDIKTLNTTIQDTLYVKSKFKGGTKYNDKYDISFYYTMDEMQNFIFGLRKSKINFKNMPWLIDPKLKKNGIFYNSDKDSLKVTDIYAFHSFEKLSINGYQHKDNLDFVVRLDSLELAHITPEIKDFAFKGFVNGHINLKQYKKEILPKASLNIKDFKFNGTRLGDLNMKINTLTGNNVFVDLRIQNEGINLLKANGFVDFSKKKPFMNSSLLLQEFPVSPLQNLFDGTFSNIRGTLTGNVQIKGETQKISYDGKLYARNFGLKIDALNTDYQFDNSTTIYLHEQTFELKNADFRDIKYKTRGKISGVIRHKDFLTWYLDLKINTNSMLVLDTPANPDELYYGKIFVGGNSRIHGYADRLVIDADMQTKSGTKLVITLNDVETEGGDDFVRIVSKQQYKEEKSNTERKDKIYEGVEMNFDLDITPDAEVEIILDQKFGSKLIAKGEGPMLLEINTNGKFNIWADFAVLEGFYNFRYAGIIDKKFKVEPGSNITWERDPFNAEMNIKAIYETFADPTVLLEEQNLRTKKMPVDVIINLKEKLIHPKITFDLELPQANAILKSQINYIFSDQDKKTLQVLSLLSSGNFFNENIYTLDKQVADGAVGTLSERGLNILNALMSQNENFQVNLDYTPGENSVQYNRIIDPQVGLKLMTKISKRVYINGKVAIPVGRYTKSSIVGDIEMEVYLNDDKNLIFRIFNKQTDLEYLGQQEGYTQGIGLTYQLEFDTFKEVLQKFGISVKTE